MQPLTCRRMSARKLAILVTLLLLYAHSSFAQEHVYFGNLHSHTSYSDGSGTPKEAYDWAKSKAHLDFLALTEHNHRDAENGAKERKDGKLIALNPGLYNGPSSSSLISAANAATTPNFVALYGQEFSSISAGNHVNVFDIQEVIDDHQVPNGHFEKLVQWLESHADSTGRLPIVQLNHANLLNDYTKEYGADDFGPQDNWIATMGKCVSLFEMLNGPAMTKTSGNRSAEVMEEEFKHYLLLGFRFSPTGDQDNHYKTWGTATDSRTGVVIADNLSRGSLLSAMRSRHTYATEDKNLRMIFKVNGRLCGDVIPTPSTEQELNITFAITDDDEKDASYKIQVYSGRIGGSKVEIVEEISAQGSQAEHGAIADVRYSGKGQFIYFKVIQANEDGVPDRAWSAPVWFEDGVAAPSVAAQPAENESALVASKNSSIYHLSKDCRAAKSIKPENRITGSAAKSGRILHQGCPL